MILILVLILDLTWFWYSRRFVRGNLHHGGGVKEPVPRDVGAGLGFGE